jgi:glutathione synthase/RimK-type ligase-like ATP-grasp enzyme
MTNDAEILVISTVVDASTDEVIRLLTERGAQVVRLNSEDLPFRSSLSIDYDRSDAVRLHVNGKSATSKSIWYRRLRTPKKPAAMDEGIYDFCLRENRAALIGGLLTQHVRWMSHPTAVWQAEFKPYQLHVAKSVGLKIPETLISNDPVAIAQMHATWEKTIVKPARSGYFLEGGNEFAVFTSELPQGDLATLEDAKWTPSIYQRRIPKKFDVRVTCVGSELFAAAIHSQTDPAASVDWRKTGNPDLPHSRIALPEALVTKLKELMAKLGLAFGCIDLVFTPDREYVFLEVNPSGQWLWLDDQLELGISRAVADWLLASP